ncbi:hypothetical protein [Micromonospora sp. NPDC051296]|uniref:hypothetical protein n=1 Tax=Micromonospora sp. NPDC051296 TaxID=3155046 RepID=UPI003416B431
MSQVATAGRHPVVLPMTATQRELWHSRHDIGPCPVHTRALRLTGTVDDTRLAASARQVVAAFDVLRAGFVTEPGEEPVVQPASPRVQQTTVDGDGTCLDVLDNHRRSAGHHCAPSVVLSVVRTAPAEVVLAVSGHPLLVDLRSLYLLLGAVMQHYLGRFRPDEYPTFTQAAAACAELAGQHGGRIAWWSRQLDRWPRPVDGPAVRVRHQAQLSMTRSRWQRLCQVSAHAGNAGPLAIVALLTWWGQHTEPARRPVFQTTFDLRDYAGLGPVIGPFTDRLVFAVDTTDLTTMTFQDLVRRVHAGLLDSVVRYVPYGVLRRLATERAPGGLPGEVLINYCRTPPTSDTTRGERTLARHGLSIELFRESDLALRGAGAHPGRAAIELELAEHRDGEALLVRADPARFPPHRVDALVRGLDRQIDQVTARPSIRLADLPAD